MFVLPISPANCVGNVWGQTVSFATALSPGCCPTMNVPRGPKPKTTPQTAGLQRFPQGKGSPPSGAGWKPRSQAVTSLSSQGVMRPEVRFQPSPGWLDNLEAAPCDPESVGFLIREQTS